MSHGGAELVDAHAHLLAPTELGYHWIDRPSPALTHLLANYYDIAHDFRPSEYRHAVEDCGVVRVVACEFGAVDPLAEARWMQQCHDATGTPDGFIAAVDLTSADLADRLARYADLPVVRAVRQPLYWSDNDQLACLGARPDYLTDTNWLRGFEQVADTSLVWDLLLYCEQLPQATHLLERFPHVPIVLEAAGWPLDRSSSGFQRWRDEMRAVSQYPNITLKLQGLALIFGADQEQVTPWVTNAVEIFGADRCMFATHLPVDGLLWTCTDLESATRAALTGLHPTALDDYFGATADRVYLGQ